MNKLGDVVFCVDCDRERQAHLEIAEAASEQHREQDREPDREPDTSPNDRSHPETASQNPEQDKHPRRMATKKDANGDPLCSQCLDDRQAKRRAEFMLSDDRRTVVHWPRRGRASDPKPVLLSSVDTVADRPAGSAAGAVTAAHGPRSRLAKPPTKSPTVSPTRLPRQDPSKNKAAFVRSLPPGTPAKDVIAQAKKHGLEITPAYVYVIRSTDGARKNNGGMQHAGREVRAKSNGRPLNGQALNHARVPDRAPDPVSVRVPIRVSDIRALRIPKPKDRGIERTFMWLAVELGFLRTEQLLDELRTKIRIVFAH
jgi:hypothetical protein